MNILVIDDSALSRRMARKVIEALGHTVTEAEDGLSGLERFAAEKPDVVVLDLLMPGIGGLEVIGHLRALSPKCQIIICSADIQTSTRERVMEAGAVGIISKPMQSEALQGFLDSM